MTQYAKYPSIGFGSWKAPVALAADLPLLGNTDGDARIDTSTETIYVWDGSAWIPVATPGAAIAIDALLGDVSATGPGAVPATVNSVGGQTAAAIAAATVTVGAATSSNTPNTLVLRNGSGNFAAGTITAALTGTASGNTTYTANNHGVVVSSATNAMTVIAPDASTTKALVSGGASADPNWAVVGAGSWREPVANVAALPGSGNTAGDIRFAQSEAAMYYWNGASWVFLTGTGLPNVQIFTSSGTWTKPVGCTIVRAECISGGGGGGSGRKGLAGSDRFGGGGAGGGNYSETNYLASDLGATEAVTVGAGGTGGASQTVDSNNGNPGGTGGTSSFNVTRAFSAPAGSAGGTAAVGASTPVVTIRSGGNGGASSTSATASAGTVAICASGGGGGGAISAANVVRDGGAGGAVSHTTTGGSQAGGAGGTAGGNGADAANWPAYAYTGGKGGGGGGASRTAGTAGNGGNGNGYGGSGGGGGAGEDGVTNSGAGGNGANGVVVVRSW